MANPFKAAARLTTSGPSGEKAKLTGPMLLPRFSAASSFNNWDTEAAIKDGFKSSGWVYSAVNKISVSMAAVPWRQMNQMEDVDGDGRRDLMPVWGSPISMLLAQPNDQMDGNLFMRTVVTHLMLSGNAIIKKRKGRVRTGDGTRPRTTTELWPINPARIEVKAGAGGNPEYSARMPNGAPMPLPREEIIHIMLVDPANPLWGMSPLQAAAKIVDTDVKAIEWNFSSMDNRGVPDGVFTFDTPLTPDQWEEARDQVKQQYLGTDNARSPWVLSSGARWNQMTMTAAELDFIESRKMSREDILAVFQVPPPMVGLYDNATLANIREAREIFWVDTIVPLLDVLAGAFMLSLSPDFGLTWPTSQVLYDLSRVDAFQEIIVGRTQSAQRMFEMGVPMSQINGIFEMGLRPWEGWDRSFVTNRVVPADRSGQQEVQNRREEDSDPPKELEED